ncbi:endolytic transglycosylase MltG [Hyphomicrobium sp. CS1BSMeth3]|uniref:endolytic transglycosylase MltG n=1 Tax=Hyphomicrobium sp. CS1BSMeth3 TaxID=1892844 RepID=UPI0009307993|nr:endolytic transglycosylase MltG [Hyphomicrobium sp. CS1BSMeth3]
MRQALPTLDTTRKRLNALPRSPAEALEPGRAPRPPRRIRERREARRMNGFLRFISGIITFCFLGMTVVAVIALLLRTNFDAPGPLTHSAVTVIPRGEGVQEIAARLEREGIVSDRRLFVAQYLSQSLHIRLTGGKEISLQAGEFEFRKQASMKDVLETLAQGKAVLYRLSVPEGLTSQQIVARLMAEENLSGEITEVPPEGSLLPDTYRFSRGMARSDILERMKADQKRFLATIWDKRQSDLPFKTIEQAIVLASIVEKETGRADERERIAGVFVNRLKRGMRLQSDPTIIYGIAGGQGTLGRPITRSDIDTPTPYNTYAITGLPPGPIANPGRAALEATLNPAKTKDLYFVADGTGGHNFSETLRDHNAAVQVWRQVERDIRARQAAAANPAPAAQADSDPSPTSAPAAASGNAGRAPSDVPLPQRKPKR